MLLPRCCGWCSAPAPIGGRIPGMGPGWIEKWKKKYFNLINNRKITTFFWLIFIFAPSFLISTDILNWIFQKLKIFNLIIHSYHIAKDIVNQFGPTLWRNTCAQIRKIWIRPVFITCRWRASTTNGCAGRCRRIGFGTSSIWTIFLFFLLLPFSRISRLHPTLPLLFLVCIFSLGCLFAFNLRAVS